MTGTKNGTIPNLDKPEPKRVELKIDKKLI
jgi:hypothetical protein